MLVFALSLPSLSQRSEPDAEPGSESSQRDQTSQPALPKKHSDQLKQELDADAIALSKISSDPLIRPDPLAPFLRPLDVVANRASEHLPLKFGATYTFLNQYATITPEGVRHDQLSGRLDLTGAWTVYQHGSTGGSISLLVRFGTNIGKSQQFNLSDELGSGLI